MSCTSITKSYWRISLSLHSSWAITSPQGQFSPALTLLQLTEILTASGTRWTRVGTVGGYWRAHDVTLHSAKLSSFDRGASSSPYQRKIYKTHWGKKPPSFMSPPPFLLSNEGTTKRLCALITQPPWKGLGNQSSEGQSRKCCFTKTNICCKGTIFAAYITLEWGPCSLICHEISVWHRCAFKRVRNI